MTIKTNKRKIVWTIFFCTQCGFEQRSIFGVTKSREFFQKSGVLFSFVQFSCLGKPKYTMQRKDFSNKPHFKWKEI